jgi:hypothetical protein
MVFVVVALNERGAVPASQQAYLSLWGGNMSCLCPQCPVFWKELLNDNPKAQGSICVASGSGILLSWERASPCAHCGSSPALQGGQGRLGRDRVQCLLCPRDLDAMRQGLGFWAVLQHSLGLIKHYHALKKCMEWKQAQDSSRN